MLEVNQECFIAARKTYARRCTVKRKEKQSIAGELGTADLSLARGATPRGLAVFVTKEATFGVVDSSKVRGSALHHGQGSLVATGVERKQP